MVRSQGSGRMPRDFSSARMEVAPVRQYREAGEAWAWSRRRMVRMVRSSSGGDPLGDAVVGPGQVVEALGAGLQVAAPPLVEPDLGAADGGANRLDGPAGEAQGDSSLASGQFVVHGYLREAAGGGCPRR
jgi:hypothetical protein